MSKKTQFLEEFVKALNQDHLRVDRNSYPFEEGDKIDRDFFDYRIRRANEPIDVKAAENYRLLACYSLGIKGMKGMRLSEALLVGNCNSAIQFLENEFHLDLERYRNYLGEDNVGYRKSVHKMLSIVIDQVQRPKALDKESIRQELVSFVASEQRPLTNNLPNSYHLSMEVSDTDSVQLVVDLLMTHLTEGTNESFSDQNTADKAWLRLLKLFTSGKHVDKIIETGFRMRCFDRYEPSTQAYMRYLQSKLYLKRGDIRTSTMSLRAIKSEKVKMEAEALQRLSSLVDIRLLTNNPMHTGEHHKLFDQAVGRLQDLPYATDSFKAYESASAIGAEIINILADFNIVDDRLIERLRLLGQRHGEIINMDPSHLANQSIVKLGNDWLVTLAQIAMHSNEDHIKHLQNIAIDGLRVSQEDNNVLFYAQSLLVLAILSAIQKDRIAAHVFVASFSLITKIFKLNYQQEGIRQLLSYLYIHEPELYSKACTPYERLMAQAEVEHDDARQIILHLEKQYRRAQAKVYTVDPREALNLLAF